MKPIIVLLPMLIVLVSCGDQGTTRHANDTDTTNNPPSAPTQTSDGGSMSQSKYDIIAYRYHADSKIFNIRLSGGRYKFQGIPQDVYDAFIKDGATSKSYMDHFDGTFKAEYVKEDPAWVRAQQTKDAGL